MAEPHSSDDEQEHYYHSKPVGEEEWSSDSDAGATAAGYSLLQNETSSDEESNADFAPQATSMEPSSDSLDDQHATPSDWQPFKTISPEEEARLRKEAFEQFDRNYQAEVAQATRGARRAPQATSDTNSISTAMSSFTMSYQPTWSGFEGIDSDDLIRDILKKNDIPWNQDKS